MLARRTDTGWEPAVFRWSGRLALTIGATAGAVALVWGPDLEGGWLAWTTLAVLAAAVAVATVAFVAAYRRQRAYLRAQARYRHPSYTARERNPR